MVDQANPMMAEITDEHKGFMADFITAQKDVAGPNEEQKASIAARQEKLKTDPEFSNQVKAQAMADFQTADEDKDGLLTEAEFLNFAKLGIESGKK